MKKLSALAAAGFLSLLFISADAQTAMNRTINPNHIDPIKSKMEPTDQNEFIDAYAVSSKIVRNFNRAYKNTNGVEWMVLKDKSLVCRFYMNNILYRAFYSRNGSWLQTASGYEADKLDRTVKEMVRSSYQNYAISYINQIDLPANRIIYLVEVQDNKSIKKIRVADDEMDVVQDIEKN
ncbi:MAG TPA: hypothetical protein VFC34_02945 [Puia sp.]|nr:hypothetical protein [Puia sp.]